MAFRMLPGQKPGLASTHCVLDGIELPTRLRCGTPPRRLDRDGRMLRDQAKRGRREGFGTESVWNRKKKTIGQATKDSSDQIHGVLKGHPPPWREPETSDGCLRPRGAARRVTHHPLPVLVRG